MKSLLSALTAAYLAFGLFVALAFGQAMPALNAGGKAYITAMWGPMAVCQGTGWCDPVPPAFISVRMFTFESR
jgi:hypothetical protein